MPDPLDPPLPSTDTDPLSVGLGSIHFDTYFGSTGLAWHGEATIRRKVVARTRGGGVAETWQDLETVPCDLVKVHRYIETAQAGEVRAVSTWEAHFLLGSQLRPQDQAVIDGVTYEIIDHDRGLAGALMLTAWLQRINAS